MINEDTSRLNAALAYAEQGFSVFPVHSKRANGSCTCDKEDCKSIGKHPRTKNGLKDATKDPSVIRFWWSNAFQGSNVAVATGRMSGFFAVDVDVKHDGIQAWKNFKDDNVLDDYETPVQNTPSGGVHVLYKMPTEGKVLTKTNVLAKGIDIRGDGGYIVVTPSDGYNYVIDQGIGEIPLQEAPQAILDQVVKIITVSESNTPVSLPVDGLFKLSKDEAHKILDALQHVDPDDYSMWWSIGAALHSTNGLDAFEWWCAWAQQSDKFDHNEHLKKWLDFDVRRGNTETAIYIEYLFKEAESNGWVETFDHSDVDFDSFNVTNEEFQQMKPTQKCNNNFEATNNISKEDMGELKLLGRNEIVGALPKVSTELPGICGKIATYIVETSRRQQPEIANLTALQVVSICGRKCKGYDGVKLNMITLGIALSAAGKERGQNVAVRLLNAVNLSKHSFGNIASHLDIINNLLHGMATNIYIIDEIHGLFNAIGGKNSASYESKIMPEILKLNTGDGYQLRGLDIRNNQKANYQDIKSIEKTLLEDQSEKDQTKKLSQNDIKKLNHKLTSLNVQKKWLSENYIPSPFFGLMGHSTPLKIDSIVCRDQIEQGFVGRTLFARGEEYRPKKCSFNHLTISEDEIIHDLERLVRVKKNVEITVDAENLLLAIDTFFENNINHPILGAVIARCYEQVIRVSSILSLPRCEITQEIIVHSLKLVLASLDSIYYMEQKNTSTDTDVLVEDRVKGIRAHMQKLAKGGIYQSSMRQSIVRSNAWLKKEINKTQYSGTPCPYDYLLENAIKSGLLKRDGNKLFSSL